ncbi:MAG: RNA-binding cell elongation regulator Jag/EloR [Bacteroidota bacterium]
MDEQRPAKAGTEVRSVEMTGRTVDEAVIAALEELGVESEEVKVEVVGEGTRGLFGLGGRYVKVRVTEVPAAEKLMRRGRRFLEDVIRGIGVDAFVDGKVGDESVLQYSIRGSGAGLLIGRRGQTLDALQLLVRQVLSKSTEDRFRVVVDVEGYRERQQRTLEALAQRMARQARLTGRPVALEPMNALERRVIHLALAGDPDVETHSEGKEPYRRVIIAPARRAFWPANGEAEADKETGSDAGFDPRLSEE